MNRALRAATIGVLLIAPVALSSCSAGQINQTSTQNRDKLGAGAGIGAIVLREVNLPFPTGGSYAQGSDAELSAAVVNGGSEPDVLVSVTGDDFAGVRVAGTGTSPLSSSSSSASVSAPSTAAGTVTGASGSASSSSSSSSSSATTSSSATGSGSATTTAGPTTAVTGPAGATGTPTATASSSSAESGSGISLAVPPDTTLYLGTNSPHVFLTGLKRSLTPGQVLRITFTFQRAGSVTLEALVAGPTSYVPGTSSFDFNLPSDASVPGSAAGGGGVSG